MWTVSVRQLQRQRAELSRRIGRQVRDHRAEAAITQAQLAECAGIHQSLVSKVEAGSTTPGLQTLLALSACLGTDLSIRLFPTTRPRITDRFQAPMVEALVRLLGPGWRVRPEFAVPAAHGVIDLVLSRLLDRMTVACECHSELRRLELVLRRANEKADGLRGQLDSTQRVSSMLLLRSTRATRDLARAFQGTLGAAYPARTADVLDALTGNAAWPGPGIVWATVEGGRGTILEGPPRGVRVGR